ncbi:MAG: hypothetical protein IPP83_06055 [Flavobacteriales bacterium]|nr:hypothetical protein [Flavobacteriales bacterium]
MPLLPFSAFAQRYFFENVSVQHGLPASKVYCATQGSDGTIWIGTEAGLASYDGVTIYNHGTADGVAPGGVRAILTDKNGGIWAGHLDGRIDPFRWSKIPNAHSGQWDHQRDHRDRSGQFRGDLACDSRTGGLVLGAVA